MQLKTPNNILTNSFVLQFHDNVYINAFSNSVIDTASTTVNINQ